MSSAHATERLLWLLCTCMQCLGKIMHCFLKNNIATQLFVPIVLKKIASGFNVVFECFIWYDAILSALWTWVLTTQGSPGSPITAICSICWWGQLFVNGNFGPWHIHTPTEPSRQTQQCVKSKNLIDFQLQSHLLGKVEFTHQISRWSAERNWGLYKKFFSSFFAQSNLHVFATIALPTSNST